MAILILWLVLGACLCDKLITSELVEKLRAKAMWKVVDHDKNKFKDYTVDEFKLMLRARKPVALPEKKDPPRNLQSATLPVNFDGRDKWPTCIHPVRDQHKCGGCWAFGTTNHLSDRFCIRGKDIILSPQNLIECDSYDDCCDGADMTNVYKFLQETGIVEDSCRAYDQQCGVCRKSSCVKYKCKYRSVWESYDVNTIKSQIYNRGPVMAIYDVYSDFVNYASGVYYHTGGELLGVHAVEILGWGEEDGMKYWLSKNEWGQIGRAHV